MIVYLAEYDQSPGSYEREPYVTVGIYTTRELAEAAVKAEIAKDKWYYGLPEVVISEWELDATVPATPIQVAEIVKHAALGAGVSIGYMHWLRSKYQ